MINMTVTGSIIILFIILVRRIAYNKVSKKVIQILWEIACLSLIFPFSFSLISIFKHEGIVSMVNNSENYLSSNMDVSRNKNFLTLLLSNQFQNVLKLMYLLIVLCLFVYIISSYYKSMKLFDEAIPIKSSCQIEKRLNNNNYIKRRKIEVHTSDRIISPVTVGVIHPKIILPTNFDVLKKILVLLIAVIHFFNPLVWVMYTLFNRDIETYCDERTIMLLGLNYKRDYALCLVNYIEKEQNRMMFQTGFSKNVIEERIEAIMKISKQKSRGIAFLAITSVSVLFIFSKGIKVDAIQNDTSDKVAYVDKNAYVTNQSGNLKAVTTEQLEKEIKEFENLKEEMVSSGTLTQDEYDSKLSDMKELLNEVESGKEVFEDENELYAEANDSQYQYEYVAEIDGETIAASTKEEYSAKIKQHIEKQVEDGNISQSLAKEKVKQLEEK